MPTDYAALTIAGSDPTGGAGIQADLQVFASLGVHGGAVVTAATVQDTRRVHSSTSLGAETVRRQLACVLADMRVGAVKTGMLAEAATARAVADQLAEHPHIPLVIDPVMLSTSGHPLLDAPGREALREVLIPRSALVTPNLPEAEALTGLSGGSLDAAAEMGRALLRLGAGAALIKGGHRVDAPLDVLVDGEGVLELPGERVAVSAHGTGCVLSAAITGLLVQGLTLREACVAAKRYIAAGLREARRVGSGSAVVNYAAGGRAVGE